MKRIKILILALLSASCTELFLGEDPKNSYAEIFEQFYKGVDETWPEFATKKVNWDSLHRLYRPQADTVRSSNSLYLVLKGLLYNLKDMHTDIYTHDGAIISYFERYPVNFYGYSWIRPRYLPGAKGNSAIAYGLLAPDVGYIYIANFSASSDKFDLIDQILNEFKDVKGIVIDVRDNGGGNSSNSEKIASRFADQSRTYAYSRFRTGPSRLAMSDLISENIAPAGPIQFKGKVAVLSNRASYSATEDFILMLKSFPNVIQVGDNTGGGSGSRPLRKELPGGWSYRVSSRLVCDLSGNPISGGLVPEIKASTSKADSLKGKDRIIETAITAVRN